MKIPRISLAATGFLILILAVDFGVLRGVFAAANAPRWPYCYLLLLLPMVDTLLIGVYRIRRRERCTPRAVGFLIGGTAATALIFASALLAPEAVYNTLLKIGRPVAMATAHALMRWLGSAAMQSSAVQLSLDIVFEVLLPIVFLCIPALVAALACGRIARRITPTPG
jgi:hypothetical protein